MGINFSADTKGDHTLYTITFSYENERDDTSSMVLTTTNQNTFENMRDVLSENPCEDVTVIDESGAIDA